MSRTASSDAAWLSLEEAARRLNVHPATLREWADKGRIRTFRTPGGHRRFNEADVAALSAAPAPDLSLFMNATVGHTRLATSGGRLAAQPWYSHFDEAAKSRQRELGLELLQLLVTYLSQPDEPLGDAVRELGRRYARLAVDVGLSLGDSMRAFHLFEGLVRSSAMQLTAARVAGGAELEERVDWFLNEVLVNMVESLSKEE